MFWIKSIVDSTDMVGGWFLAQMLPISGVSRICGTHEPRRAGREAVAAVMLRLIAGAH